MAAENDIIFYVILLSLMISFLYARNQHCISFYHFASRSSEIAVQAQSPALKGTHNVEQHVVVTAVYFFGHDRRASKRCVRALLDRQLVPKMISIFSIIEK
jgi:hypothetical protein